MKGASRFFYFLIFGFYFFLAGEVLSAQDVFKYPLAGGSMNRYMAICDELAANNYIKGSFELIRTVRRGRTMESNGYFIINAGTGVVWDTRSPVLSIMTVGRDFIIQSSPGKPRSVTNTGGNPVFLNMAETFDAVFTGKAAELIEKFDNFFIENRTGNGTTWTIGLIPKEKTVRNFIDRIVLEGKSGNGDKSALISSITMYDRSGESTRYNLSNHNYPIELSDEEKSFFSVE